MAGNVSWGGATCGRVDYVDHPERKGGSKVEAVRYANILFSHFLFRSFKKI